MRSWRQLLRILGSIATILLLILWLNRLGWDEILLALRRIPQRTFLIALGIMALSRLAVTARWHILLRAADLKVSLWQTVRLTFAGLFASNLLPTTIGGDVVRLAGGIHFGVDSATCTASLIVDRLIGMAGMATVLPFGLVRLLGGIGMGDVRASLANASPLVIGCLHQENWLGGIWDNIRGFLRRIGHAISNWLGHPRSLLGSLVFTWLHQLCLFTVIWMFIHEMGEVGSFLMVGGLWSLIYFVTLLPISINGLGLQEVAVSFFFSNVGGLSLQASLTLALLVRFLYMLTSLPGIAFIPLIFPGSARVQDAESRLRHAHFDITHGMEE